ncbi:right-handed parallel beta-helix repeat-containing protein [Actomonas aquatica]|uniref:Right-handed parallel beta-helix repeat-containing protein n=1 Tax=Actomonas aquatica TaxID=2866162 RepID=A0ABZ1C918_9BACT|nr:right-handed parallel beta-helix repeat-containing protein [Opitutus sp. WL0086]WRQ87978.1 right-handed parallel beta-helix repeat-containing protein [Opitutus sp. WL0086]
MRLPRLSDRLSFVLGALLLWPALILAQPSGGPYGPIQQRYEVPTRGTVYYVAPDGVADATGDSLATPTTLESAIAQVVTGDTIVLRGGVYRTGSLRLSQGITMQPYLDERPVIKGTQVATEWEADGEDLWRTTWTRLFPAEPADWWRREWGVRHTPLHKFNNDMVFVDGHLLGSAGSREEVTAETYFIDYENAAIFLGVDPTDKVVEITAHNSALTRTTRTVHGKANDGKGPTLRGLTFTQYARLALLVEGTEPGAYMSPDKFGKEIVGTTFEHLTISHCSRVAGYFRGDGLTMRHCLVSDTGTEGIYVINSADVLLERNIVTRTNSPENLGGYFASSVKIFNQSYNCVVRDNLIIDNPNASGVWYDVGNVDGIFINNWVENTPNGFFFEISKGAICANNVFVDSSIRVLNSSDVAVYQNTLYNSEAAFQRSARSHAANDHFGWHASAGPDVDERDGHVLVNNLVVADDSKDGPLANFWQHEAVNGRLTTPQVTAMDGNVLVRRAGVMPAQALIHWAPAPEADGFAKEYASIAELHADVPLFGANGLSWVDYGGPLFRGAELGNFELLPEFPGRAAGVALPEEIAELLGRIGDERRYPGAIAPLD